jgi:transposase
MRKIQTKKLKSVNSDTLLATVDIGKNAFSGYARCPDRSEMKPSDFSNNLAGFVRFCDILVQRRKAHGLKQIVLGFESTGAYAEPLLHFLKDKPVRLVQVNPMHTKRVKELNGNSPNKTDQKDPKVIADIIELGHGLTVLIPEGAAAELRRLTQARERAIKRRTALFNQLHDLVFISFPEFLQVIKNIKTKSARYLLCHHARPESIVREGLASLTQALKRVSRGRLGPAKAQSLFEAAASSVGLREGRLGVDLEIQALLEAIEGCERFVQRLEIEMTLHLEEVPYSRLLLSMKGLGPISVAGLIGEVGDFRHFDTQKEILKLAGLDLFEISSGKHKGQRRISKRGRPLLRKILYFAALNTVRKGGIMHEHYQQHLQKGMPRPKALIAIARKLLGIMLALVRTQTEYAIDRQIELAKVA